MSLPDSNLADVNLADAPELEAAPAPTAKPPARAVFVEKPRANIYTALLALSFTALVIGSLLLAHEMKAYDWDFKAAASRTPG